MVRQVKDARYRDALFPVWRYHPFFTNTDLATAEADVTHRQHAIIETVFADVIDGPLAHIPSGRFGANSAWVLCAAIAHNLLRAAGVLAGDNHSRARGSTLRRKIVNVPARLARPQRRPVLHLPTHWPWSKAWLSCGTTPSDTVRHCLRHLDHPPQGPTGAYRESWTDQRQPHARIPNIKITTTREQSKARRWIEVKQRLSRQLRLLIAAKNESLCEARIMTRPATSAPPLRRTVR